MWQARLATAAAAAAAGAGLECSTALQLLQSCGASRAFAGSSSSSSSSALPIISMLLPLLCAAALLRVGMPPAGCFPGAPAAGSCACGASKVCCLAR